MQRHLKQTLDCNRNVRGLGPGHRDISGNCKADELAKGIVLTTMHSALDVGIPLSSAKTRIRLKG